MVATIDNVPAEEVLQDLTVKVNVVLAVVVIPLPEHKILGPYY